ncbi:hypothetical protein BS17DRAFT_820521 [Gyrodon lividus]|nr:hypothetical protein BS17DRAFT_820521 [Gyrodon lividus]
MSESESASHSEDDSDDEDASFEIEEVEDGGLKEDNEHDTEDGDSHEDNLSDRHRADVPAKISVKRTRTADLLTIFSDRVTVKFMSNNIIETKIGRWCNVCKEDKTFVAKNGK